MKKTLSFIIVIIALFLLVASYYLSIEILTPEKPSLVDEVDTKNQISFANFGLPEPETIRFQNGTLRLRGWYFKHSKKQNCGMILLHEFSDSKTQMLPYASSFWKRGCSLFVFDARAHGESDGNYSTYGYHEKMDLERAVEYFSEIDNIPEDRIGIFGVGLGGATALQFADGQFEYGFVIADTPFRDMRSYVERTFSSLYSPAILLVTPLSLSMAELRGDLLVNDVSPQNTAKLIEKPVLILVPNISEGQIKYDDAYMIFGNLKTKSKQLVQYTNSIGKLSSDQNSNSEYDTVIQDFLKEIQFGK
ncbi:alpha/beta hydrolase [Leptospira sp. WS39.C2]